MVLGEIKGNRASKLKKGLFNVERVPKGIFWGETYFLDFYSITHTIKLFPTSNSNISIWNFDNLEHSDELKIGLSTFKYNFFPGPEIPLFGILTPPKTHSFTHGRVWNQFLIDQHAPGSQNFISTYWKLNSNWEIIFILRSIIKIQKIWKISFTPKDT